MVSAGVVFGMYGRASARPTRPGEHMSKAATTRIVAGVYEVNGSADADGKPYRIVREGDTMPGDVMGGIGWIVRDSRGRVVSSHFTRRDAVASVEADAPRGFGVTS